jgi:hypothetical membrane protein
MFTYITLNTGSELFCFFVAIVSLWRDKRLVWRSATLYLLITCITEIMGIYLKKQHHPNNAWVYNISMVFEAAFVGAMFIDLLRSVKYSRIIIITGLVLLLIPYYYELSNHGICQYNDLTYTIMSVPFIVYSLFYYYKLLADENYINLWRSAQFWWVAGTLFFYFGSTACDIFYAQLMIEITPKHYLSTYIYKVLNIFLYGCWSYSFICRKWLKKT